MQCLLVAALLVLAVVPVRPGALLTVNPAGASIGVTINITGTGFHKTAAKNTVTFVPAGGGAPVSVPAATISTIDSKKGIRRVSVAVPTGLPAGRANLRVTNTGTGETAEGAAIDIVSIALPDVASAAPGAAEVAVRIAGSAGAQMTATSRPSFGAGVKVTNLVVESPAAIVATVTVAANAAPGPRNVAVTTPTQSLLAIEAFHVGAAAPVNHPPVIASEPLLTARDHHQYRYQVVAQDADADPVTIALRQAPAGMVVDDAGLVTWTPTSAQIGVHAVSLEVSDGRGGAETQSFEVLVRDLAPPIVTLTTPSTATAGAEVVVTAISQDNVGVASLALFVDGLLLHETSTPSHTLTFTAPDETGASVQIRALARDAAGNEGESTSAIPVTDAVDVSPPTIERIIVPPQAAPGEQFTVRALVADDRGVASVRFTFDGIPGAPLTTPPFETTLQVPGNATPGSVLPVAALVRDAAGNEATGQAEVLVVAAADTAAPASVTLDAPATASPGESVLLTAAATDDVGIARVVFLRDGIVIGDTATAPFQLSRVLPPDAPPGSQVRFDARAFDFAGNGADAEPRFLTVVAQDATFALARSRSLDGSGNPLGAVTVLERGPRGERSYLSDVSSGFVALGQGAGAHAWRFSKAGYLPVWRQQPLTAGQIASVPTPWLARRHDESRTLSPLSGGEVSDAAGRVVVRAVAGAFPSPAQATLTALTAQSLPGLLPVGWSPLQAFWLELSVEPTLAPSADVTLWAPMQQGDIAALVRWDETALGWVVVAPVDAPATTASLTLPGSGAYAIVVADAGALAPPAPQVGQGLRPSSGEWPDAATLVAAGQVVPSVSAASTRADDVTATATLSVTHSDALPSGMLFPVALQEHYEVQAGQAPIVQAADAYVAAYRIAASPTGAAVSGPPVANALHAVFPVRPRVLLGPEALVQAQVTMDALAMLPAATFALPVDGGSVPFNGFRIETAPGDATETALVAAAALETDPLAPLAGNAGTVVHAFSIDINGLAAGRRARLLFDADQPSAFYVLARVHSDGLTGLEPIERFATLADGTLQSIDLPLSDGLPGLTRSGLYVVVRVSAAHGIVRVITRDAQGTPAGGLVARIAGAPWTAISDPDGRAALVAPVGSAEVLVTDAATGSAATLVVDVTDPATPVIADLSATPAGPRVAAVDPAPESTNVRTVAPIEVTFSEPIRAASLGPDGVRLLDPSGTPVRGALTLNLANTVATLLPDVPLEFSTAYTVDVSPAIVDETGLPIEGPLQFALTTEHAAVRSGLGAQLISYAPGHPDTPCQTVPGFDHTNLEIACVEGTQGTADAEVPVILVNDTSGATAAVLSNADGSFKSFIAATQDDFISATFVNANGTRITVPLARQIFADGRVGLFNSGGVLEAPSATGPIQIIIEPGAIATKTVFSLQTVEGAQLQSLLKDTPPIEARTLGKAVHLSMSGDRLTQAARVSFPVTPEDLGAPPDAKPENGTYALALATVVDGVVAYAVTDKMEYDGGRLITRSPPFDGIEPEYLDALAQTVELIDLITDPVYAVVMLPLEMALNSGPVVFTGSVLEQPVDDMGRPVSIPRVLPGALVTARPIGVDPFNADRPGRLDPGTVYAISNAAGKYSLLLPRQPPPASGHIVTANHPRRLGVRVVEAVQGSAAPFILVARQDLVFRVPAASVPDPSPPRLSPSHSPFRPTPGGEATLRVLATHGSASPTVTASVAQVISLVPGVQVELSDATITPEAPEPVGAFGVRQPFVVRSDKAVRVVLSLQATVAGNSATAAYAIDFGGSDPVTENPPNADRLDRIAPYVVQSLPSDRSRGHAPGEPIVLRFSEAIDKAIVDRPELVQMAGDGGPVSYQPVLRLSADQRELTITYYDLAPDTEHTLTLSSEVKDLANPPNPLDQDRTTPDPDSFTLRFRTAPAREAALPGMVSGGGVVTRGIFAYALERAGPLDGALVVVDLSDPQQPTRVAELSVPGFPRDLTLVPRYSFVRRPGDTIESKDLLVIVGGKVGGGVDELGNFVAGGGQFLWVVDISNPRSPSRLASELIAVSPTTAVTKVVWSPPFIAYLESNADIQTISLLNLQRLILADFIPASDFTPDGTQGVDTNNDGDFVDPGEELPLPCRCPGEISAKVGVLAVRDTTQRINDFAFDWRNRYLGVTLTSGKRLNPATGLPSTTVVPPSYRTLLSGGLNLDPASFTEPIRAAFPLPDTDVKRLHALFGVPIVSNGEETLVDLALVSVARDGGPAVEVIDITDPLAPQRLQTIGIPPEHGAVHSIVRREDGKLLLSATTDILILDPALLTADPQGETRHPALIGVLPNAGHGARTFTADPAGLSVTSHGGRSAVLQTAPTLRFVSFVDTPPFDPQALVDAPFAAIDERFATLRLQSMLAPARFRTVPGVVASSLSPPSPAAHYYVLIDAPGSAGPTLAIALESLNHAGYPHRNRGLLFPPVRSVTPDTATLLGQAALPPCDPEAAPLTAYRLSSNPADPRYNQYLTTPFALTYESLSVDDIAALNTELPRAILWSGHFLRASLEPALASNTVVGSFAASVDAEQLVLRPGASVVASSLPADYILGPNPPPTRGGTSVPGTLGVVNAHNGEIRIETTDLMLPGRRLPIEFKRAIGGQDLYEGPFGRGWDFNYNQRLVELSPELFPVGLKMPLVQRGAPADGETADVRDVLFHTGAGRTLIFKHAGDEPPAGFAEDPLADELGWLDGDTVAAYYMPPTGVFDMLVKLADGRFARLTPDGTQFWYSPQGRLARIQDRYDDNTLTFVSNDRGELTQIRDELDRAVEIGYWRAQSDPAFRSGIDESTSNGNLTGKIRRLIDYTGREIRYDYSDRGQLAARKGPRITVAEEDGFLGEPVATYFYRDCSAPDASAASISGLTGGSAAGAPLFVASALGTQARDVVSQGRLGDATTSLVLAHDNTAAAVDGGVTTVTGPDGGQLAFTFDEQGRPSRAALSGGGSGAGRATSYEYENGLVTRITYPEGNSVEYEYDTANVNIRARANITRITHRVGSRPGVDRHASLAYDPRYNVPSGTQTDFAGNTIAVVPTSDGRDIERVTYATGEANEFTYNEFGQVLTHHTADGIVFSFEYDAATGFRTKSSRGSLTTTYQFGGPAGQRGLPSSSQDPKGIQTVYAWDERDQLVRISRAGAVTRLGYDESGRLKTRSKPVDGNVRRIERRTYDALGLLQTRTIENVEVGTGATPLVTEYRRDDAGRVTEIVHPDGSVQTFQYNGFGDVTGFTLGSYVETYEVDGNGNRTSTTIGDATYRYTYDGHNRLTVITSPTGGTTTRTFDGNNNVRSIVVQDPQFGTLSSTTIDVDARDRRTKVTHARSGEDAAITEFRYLSAARQVIITDPANAVFTVTYDDAGRSISEATPARTVEIELDANSNPEVVRSIEGGNTYEQTYTYNDLNHPLTHADDLGGVATFDPRLDGAIEAITDARSNRIEQRFSVLGEPLSRTLPNGVGMSRSYDEMRRLASAADGGGAGLGYQYDDSGRYTGVTHPDGSQEIYSDFDARRRPRQMTLPGGAQVAMTYDAEGRPTSMSLSDAGGQLNRQETYTYDVLGRLREATYPGGSAQFTVDEIGVVESATFTQNGTSYTIAQQTNAAGHRRALTYPSITINEGRDIIGRLLALTPAGATPVVVGTTYEAEDLVGERQMGDGIVQRNTFDARKRPLVRSYTNADGRLLAEVRYAYDETDNPVARQYVHRNGRGDFFAFDEGHRLLRADIGVRPAIPSGEAARPFAGFAQPPQVPGSWKAGFNARQATYDAHDVLTGSTSINPDLLPAAPFPSVTSGIDAFRHIGLLDGTFVRDRNEQGNTPRTQLWVRPPSIGPPVPVGATLHHDAQGRLVRIDRDDGARIDQQFDHRGLRFRRTVTCPAGTAASCVASDIGFVYDLDGRLIEEYDLTSGNILQARYYYGDDGDELLAGDLRTGAGLERFYFLTDAQGSVMAVADAAGEVVERVAYDAWGQPSIEPADTAPPRVARVVSSGDGLLIEFSERVLPPLTGASGSELLTTLDTLSGAIVVRVNGAERSGSLEYVESLPGFPFGATVRFTPEGSPLAGDIDVSVAGGKFADEWNNLNASESVPTFAYDPAPGAVLHAAFIPGGTSPGLLARSAIGSPVLFHGQVFDYDTGLVYMRARFYEPATGLFLERDPRPYSDSPNHYAGFANNPVRYRDPSGAQIFRSLDLPAVGRNANGFDGGAPLHSDHSGQWIPEFELNTTVITVRPDAVTESGLPHNVATQSDMAPVDTTILDNPNATTLVDEPPEAPTESGLPPNAPTETATILDAPPVTTERNPFQEPFTVRDSYSTTAEMAAGPTMSGAQVMPGVADTVIVPTPIPTPGGHMVDDVFVDIDAAPITLRFGPDDLVYGPSANRALRNLQKRAGGVLLNDIKKPAGVDIVAFSLGMLENAAASGRKVHFDVTHMEDVRGVLAGTFKETAVTSQELRYIAAHWDRFKSVVTFYRDGKRVRPTW